MNRAFSTIEIKSADEATGTIVGIASTPETDRMGDQVMPEGAQFKLPLPLLLGHAHDEPIGVVQRATVTAAGIEIVAKVALGISERIDEAWRLIRAGLIRGLSVGFRPLKHEPLPGGGLRFLAWELFEVSAVSIPANVGATITNIKHFAGQPVVALPAPQPEKRKAKTVTLQSRISDLEQIADGALVYWLARAKALGRDRGDAEAVALELGAPPELAARLKAAVAAETTTGQPGLAGSSRAVTAFVSQASETSVLMRMIADRATYPVPLRTRVYRPEEDMVATVVAEGRPVPIQGFPLSGFTVEPVKIGGAIAVTDELLRATSRDGQALLNSMLRAAVAKAADEYMFSTLTNSGTLIEAADTTDSSAMAAYALALGAVATRAADRIYAVFGTAAWNFGSAPERSPQPTRRSAGAVSWGDRRSRARHWTRGAWRW